MAIVIPHHDLPAFPIAGATITGIATASMGAKEYEVWRSTIAPMLTPLDISMTRKKFLYFSLEKEK